MSQTALKLSFEETMTKGPLFAFPRVIHNPSTPPVFIVEDHEIERLAFKMPTVPVLPYTYLVDDQGRVHVEINHSSYFPSKSIWKTLMMAVRPEKYFYDLLRTKIIEGSCLKNERRLIGGAICAYYADRQETEVKLLGTLPREETLDVSPEVRKKAMNLLIKWHHPLLRWLGAKRTHTTPCVIPIDKMIRNGWFIKPLRRKERLEKFRDGLPMSLLKTQHIFVDGDYENKCRTYPETHKCDDCAALTQEDNNPDFLRALAT